MEKVLRMLSTRERAVTELAFGIGHDEPRTDEDIASMLQIKKRRVQAAKTDAMNKLRQPTVKKWLVELVGKPTAK
jgi:DNA-directed RNA polymerase sigma subunit (sigma70/sigma32)